MHRSGTSAATRLISFLGLTTPTGDDLVPPSAKNPTGYWESMSLVALNTRVLNAVGSDFRCPSVLSLGWERDERLEELRLEAQGVFHVAFPVAPWVWKDPRTCLTLAFWREVLPVQAAAVLVNRNPLEIAASAQRTRGDESLTYTLALWERYLREALAQVSGMPLLVTAYKDVLAAPAAWCARVRAFLVEAGVRAEEPRASEVTEFVDQGLRHSHYSAADLDASPEVSASQRELFRLLEGLQGAHLRFAPPRLPAETPRTVELLDERRQALSMRSPMRRSWVGTARGLPGRALRLLLP